MTNVRGLVGVLGVLLLVGFAAGCGLVSDQPKQEAKKKVEAKGQQVKQEVKKKVESKARQAKKKIETKGQQAKQEVKKKSRPARRT
jgi:predicted Holliday junction resolvase-like endonuclease